MSKVYVFGHKNPDTDSICSAIAYADLKKQLGLDVEAVRLGDVNKETQFALNYFKVDYPNVINSSEDVEKDVILVDHNEFQQSVDGIESLNIRSEEHTSELQSRGHLVCRLLLEKK